MKLAGTGSDSIAVGAVTSPLRRLLRPIVRYRPRTRLFVVEVAAVALLALVIPPTWSAPVETWWAPALVLLLCGLALEFLEVPAPRAGALSVSAVVHVALILIVPPPWSALGVGATVLAHQALTRQPADRLVFNVANHVLAVAVACQAVGLIGQPSELLMADAIPLGYLAALVAALTYYVINVGLVAIAVSLATGRRLRYVLAVNNRSTLLPDIAAETLGVLLAASWYAMPQWVLLLGVPTAVIARTLQMIRRLERETVEAVETLADSIDDRDPGTFHHSLRVSQYAVALAISAGADDHVIDLIGLAARVHDLGKMGIGNEVLMKPAPLDDDEGERMWEHPVIGARILGNYDLYREGATLVRAHYERWDGKGYPDGLAGDAIPLGARIIAVADAFDAMTSDRPYRPGMDPRRALDVLRRGAGVQWDPVLVGHFIRLATDPAAELPDTPAIGRLRAFAEVDARRPSHTVPVVRSRRRANVRRRLRVVSRTDEVERRDAAS
jgi:HD-GYP domain-containing protein (c-di-GMP phosphodiesterase class II)